MSNKILIVKNLNVKFDEEEIIKDLSFEVTEGDVITILGPNGSGKTTLLRTLVGLLPYTGEIYWATKNISYLPPQELFQRKGLPPLSIKDFFKFKRVSSMQILAILDSVGLDSSVLQKKFLN